MGSVRRLSTAHGVLKYLAGLRSIGLFRSIGTTHEKLKVDHNARAGSSETSPGLRRVAVLNRSALLSSGLSYQSDLVRSPGP